MMILHPFHISSTGTDFPEKMNNPFDYEPHPLCIQICKELQTYLENKKEWREEIDRGKMFGILIVEKPSDIHEGRQLGYLAAYSGQIGGRSDWDDFVPAVFDYLQPDGYFKTHEAEITHINESILRLEKDERMQKARTLIADLLPAPTSHSRFSGKDERKEGPKGSPTKTGQSLCRRGTGDDQRKPIHEGRTAPTQEITCREDNIRDGIRRLSEQYFQT